MPPLAPPAIARLDLASTPPPHLSAKPAPVSLRAKGAGELRTAHRYPLGDLAYTADPSGRGMLAFQMGRGFLMLSGADADQVEPGTYRLHLDVVQIQTLSKVQGDCTLTLSPDGRVYRALTCEGVIQADGERLNLTWRGVEAPAEPLR